MFRARREVRRPSLRERPYGFKKHDATSLHYDLRLELNGRLLSFALPEGPSCIPGVCRQAIQMEDHRKDYLSFEGLHRTGTIMLWDQGSWEPCPGYEDVEECLRKGTLFFKLYGEKLDGDWMLVRSDIVNSGGRAIWFLAKLEDGLASSHTDKCVLEELPNSVTTNRTLEEIVRDWQTPKKRDGGQSTLF
jgi:bifunctional non-homologous end joining protein LigD